MLTLTVRKDTIAKRRSKYLNDFMKSNSPSAFSIYEYDNLVFSFLGWFILPVWISNKSDTFLKINGSAAIKVCFLGVIDPKPKLNDKN